MKMSVEIKSNLNFAGASAQIVEAARLGLRDTVVNVTNDAVKGSPKKTGHNARSIAAEVSGMGVVASGGEGGVERVVDDKKIEGAVYSTSGYGGHLETGTKPHIIEAKNASVLTDGKNFFGKIVHHPGTTAQPYIKPAVNRNFTEEKYANNVKRHLKND